MRRLIYVLLFVCMSAAPAPQERDLSGRTPYEGIYLDKHGHPYYLPPRNTYGQWPPVYPV